MNAETSQATSCQPREDLVKARVSSRLKKQFTDAAAAQGRKPSEALREAMAEWVQRVGKAA